MLKGSELSIDLRDSFTPDLLHTGFLTLSNIYKDKNNILEFQRIT